MATYFTEHAPPDGALIRYGVRASDAPTLNAYARLGRYSQALGVIVQADLTTLNPQHNSPALCWEPANGQLIVARLLQPLELEGQDGPPKVWESIPVPPASQGRPGVGDPLELLKGWEDLQTGEKFDLI